MPMGLQNELESILGHKVRPYWQAYLLGIPDLFIYPLVWMANIAEELKAKAEEAAAKAVADAAKAEAPAEEAAEE